MSSDTHFSQFNFKFSQCNLLDETPRIHQKKTKKIKNQIQEQQPVRPMNDLEKNVSLLFDLYIFNL